MTTDLLHSLPADGLVIPWREMPTYNTVMAVAGGAALLMLVSLIRELLREPKTLAATGYAIGLGVTGFICTTTGLHMTLTWPLAGAGFAFDNIIFGETTLALGVAVLGVAAWLIWGFPRLATRDDGLRDAARHLFPLTIFGFGMGLGAIGIAAAGVTYQLFAAPAEEPISGLFADYPMVEASFISLLFLLVGIGCIALTLLVRAVKDGRPVGGLHAVVHWSWLLSGAAFLLFGALNFFTHIGLIVNTMG